MPVSQQGAINTTALIVPDLYVQIVPPSVSLLNGVPTNVLGIVGTAQWGPVNSASLVGSTADYARIHGSLQNRKYDMGTAVAAAVQQGAASMRCVRVTDGSDTAATAAIQSAGVAATGSVAFTANPVAATTLTLAGTVVTFVAGGAAGNQVNIGASLGVTLASLLAFLQASPDVNIDKFTFALNGNTLNLAALLPGVAGNTLTLATNVAGATASGATLAGGAAGTLALTLSGKYTGSLGNSLQATIAAGSQTGTAKVTLALSGFAPEVFDNIPGAGNALWLNMAAAINNGNSVARPASVLVSAVAGAAAGVAAYATSNFAGGTDGANNITGALLLGSDLGSRSGMYSLRSSGAAVAMLADCDDASTYAAQAAFGLSEGIYMVGVTPQGDTPAAAAAAKAAANIDSYAFKLLLGDWVYWSDPVNSITRVVSPQAFVAGLLANLSPEQSSLNKALYGIVATQRSIQSRPYAAAELQVLGQAGIDVIANPVPGGAYFGTRFGHNSSSNPVTNGDNYTRMTNYIAYTLNAGMGKFVGRLQSSRSDDPTRLQAKATVDGFLANMRQQGQVADFSTICDLSNNLAPRIATGYMQMDAKVQYLSVVEKFLVNMEGGQSVQVARTSTVAAN